MRATRIHVPLLLLTCCALALAACSSVGPNAPAPSPPSPQPEPTKVIGPIPTATPRIAPTADPNPLSPQLGDTAPDFTLPSVEGGTVTLSDYHGVKNVVLLFYRTGG